MRIDLAQRRLTKAGVAVRLSRREFDLLAELAVSRRRTQISCRPSGAMKTPISAIGAFI